MTTIRLPAELPIGEATETPKIAGRYKGTAIVLGCGPTVWEDLARLSGIEADIIAVNEVGIFLPQKPVHWVSLHAECFQWMLPLRKDFIFDSNGLHMGGPINTHSIHRCAGVMHVWPKLEVPPGDGGSALAACRIGFRLGYEREILAGIPLDGRRHFYDPPSFVSPVEFECYLGAFKGAARNEFRGRVTSMSGKTRELLGAPAIKGA